MKQYFQLSLLCLFLGSCTRFFYPEFTRTEQEIYDAVIDTIQKPSFLPSHANLVVVLDPYVEYSLIWVAIEKHPSNPYLLQFYSNYHGSKIIDTTTYFEQHLSIIPKLNTYKVYGSGARILVNGKWYWMHQSSGQDPYKKCNDYFSVQNYKPNPFKEGIRQEEISDWAPEHFSCIKFISQEEDQVKALITNEFQEETEQTYRIIRNQDAPSLDSLAILYRWKPNGRIYLSEKGAYLDPINN